MVIVFVLSCSWSFSWSWSSSWSWNSLAKNMHVWYATHCHSLSCSYMAGRRQDCSETLSLCGVLFAEAAEFCSVNVTSSDLALLADTDNVTVRCGVSYRALYQWIPRVQCLPNVLGQTELTEESSDGITYTKSFNATPDINGVVVNCSAKLNSTGYEPVRGDEDNTPDDVQLWKSAPLHVQCKQCLSAEIFCE